MIQFHVFPGGKPKALTFSYDDGKIEDQRLIGLFNKYDVKGTFHLNTFNYLPLTEEKAEELRNLYAGHEIACHTVNHGWPTRMLDQSILMETLEDRKVLEQIAGYPVKGMSYPFGAYDETTIHQMRSCGIVYSRTVNDTHRFHIPKDFMEWHPTCHHKDMMEMGKKFLDEIDYRYGHPLLYIWGHSFEFRTEEDWAELEQFLQMISHNDKIWYATNMEIYRYVQAQRRLEVSLDEKILYNPSAIDVWVDVHPDALKGLHEYICIPAGETVVRK